MASIHAADTTARSALAQACAIGDPRPISFRDAFPIFHTPDVERIAAFYCDELGFTRGYRFPAEGDADFVVLSLGGFAVGFARAAGADDARRVDLWLYTDDVDREVDRLRTSGAKMVAAPADREWGERMATVADPDGNLIHIGSAG